MNLTQSEVSALYVSLFGRSSEGAGNKYWQEVSKTQNLNIVDIANSMLKTDAAKEFFGNSMNSNEAFIAHIYETTLHKDIATDNEGKNFWINALNNGTDRGTLVVELLKAALNPKYAKDPNPYTKGAHDLLVAKIIASNATADSVENIPSGQDIKDQLKPFIEINNLLRPDFQKEAIKKTIEDKKDILQIDNAKLENSIANNDNVKIISDITHRSKDEIQKELQVNYTPENQNGSNENALKQADENSNDTSASNTNKFNEKIIIKAGIQVDSSENLVKSIMDIKEINAGDKILFEGITEKISVKKETITKDYDTDLKTTINSILANNDEANTAILVKITGSQNGTYLLYNKENGSTDLQPNDFLIKLSGQVSMLNAEEDGSITIA